MSPTYFFDEASMYECEQILKQIDDTARQEWERARMQMWIVAQVNSTSEIDIQDVMHLPWDDSTEDDEPTDEITRELELESLRKTAKEYERYINPATTEDGGFRPKSDPIRQERQ